MIKLNHSLRSFINELAKNHLREFNFITLLVLIDAFLLTFSVIILIPLVDLFLNSAEKYSQVTKYLINFFEKIGLPVNLLSFFSLFIITTFLKTILSIGINYQIQIFKFKIYISLFKRLFNNIYNARWLFFNDLGRGKLFNTFKQALARVGEGAGFFGIFISSIIQLIIYSIVPLILNYKLFLLIIFFSLVIIYPYKTINRYSKKLGNENISSENRLVSSVQEMISNSKYFISIGKSKILLNNSLEFLKKHYKSSIYFNLLNFSVEQIIRPIFITIILLSIMLTKENNVNFSEYTAFFWSLMAIVPLISKILHSFSILINYSPSYDQYKRILNKSLKLKEFKGTIAFKKLEKNILFKNINFSYGKNKILKNLDLIIKENKINFIFGKSGKGKSTIIDLLTGIQVPDKGEIFVNGKNLKKIDKKSFREKIGIVNQDLTLFYDTIKNNIVLFEKEFSKKEIKKALLFSGSDKSINKLNKKMTTFVGERGTQLSGGQRQRLLLARSLLRKPELLILDEAINSLDKNSRKTIMKKLRKISSKTTIIIISHDNLNIDKGDNIIRF